MQEPPQNMRKNIMKKIHKKTVSEDMQPEYDFSHGVRGKHFKKYREGNNVVVIEPDIAKVFSTPKAVNSALRGLYEIMRQTKHAHI